jgi:tRNA threonylcarbamoyladenosine biosynthesis protein TsaB
MTEMMSEAALAPEALLSGFSEKIVFAGEGAVVYRDKIISAMGEDALFAPADKMVPSPSALAVLGLQMAAAGPEADLFNIVPRYIRRSEAEVQLDEKNRASGR